jgi:hypothetical protein
MKFRTRAAAPELKDGVISNRLRQKAKHQHQIIIITLCDHRFGPPHVHGNIRGENAERASNTGIALTSTHVATVTHPAVLLYTDRHSAVQSSAM